MRAGRGGAPITSGSACGAAKKNTTRQCMGLVTSRPSASNLPLAIRILKLSIAPCERDGPPCCYCRTRAPLLEGPSSAHCFNGHGTQTAEILGAVLYYFCVTSVGLEPGCRPLTKKICCPEGRLPPLLRTLIRGKEIKLLFNNTCVSTALASPYEPCLVRQLAKHLCDFLLTALRKARLRLCSVPDLFLLR